MFGAVARWGWCYSNETCWSVNELFNYVHHYAGN